MEYIENRTFDEIKIGDSASLSRTLIWEDIELFAVLSGDVNPAHLDQEYARSDMFHKIIAHGMWGATLLSTLLGTKLPGPGTIYLGQTLRFQHPVTIGDRITASVAVTAKDENKHRLNLECNCINQKGEVVISGCAEVIAPVEKIKRPRISLPEVHLHNHGVYFQELIDSTKGLEPIRVAVVNPVQPEDMYNLFEATQANLIVPVLVGQEKQIQAAAKAAGVDLSGYRIVPTEHSLGTINQAIALARATEVEALMKGSLSTEELMKGVREPETGLCTNRKMSHVLMIEVQSYPRPILLTDTVLNIYPDLDTKRDIVQNAIDLAHTLGIELPKVAILSAIENLKPEVRSTLDAAALCKMADRGQLTGGVVDGPLTFDTAVSSEAANSKGINSAVAGQANVLVVPDFEAGNMLARQLEYLAEAQSAGIVLGGRVPIILTNPAESQLSRLAACALALLSVRRYSKPHSYR
jgi:phosphate acetyltransferase/phosphate butyryltransferase